MSTVFPRFQPLPALTLLSPVSRFRSCGSPGSSPVWAAVALPMAALAWLVAPALADRFAGDWHRSDVQGTDRVS